MKTILNYCLTINLYREKNFLQLFVLSMNKTAWNPAKIPKHRGNKKTMSKANSLCISSIFKNKNFFSR